MSSLIGSAIVIQMCSHCCGLTVGSCVDEEDNDGVFAIVD